MPKPRRSGGNTSMRCSSSQMLPAESVSSPAMQLSAVVLPQPEGPSSATNSPRPILIESSLRAATSRPAGPAKRRDTASSRSSLKSLFIDLRSFGLLRADLLVPFAEGIDHLLGVERLRVRELCDPFVVFGPPEFLDHVLALLRRHRQRHVLHGRTRIEVALVVGQRLLLG